MKNSQLTKWFGLFCLSVGGCDVNQSMSPEDNRFYFSNDTVDTLIFYIDQKPVVAPQNSIGSVLLSPGIHTMSTEEGQLAKFIVYPESKGGVLNPKGNIYYAYSFVYGTNGIPSVYHLTPRSLIINGYAVSGKIQSWNEYVIDNNIVNCDFMIGEQVPGELSTSTRVSQVKTKCFSHQELVDAIATGEPLISQLSVKKLFENEPESVSLSFDYSVLNPSFTHRELAAPAGEIINIINHFIASTDPNKKQFYYNQYQRLVYIMAQVYSQLDGEDSLEDKQKYSLFMRQTREVFRPGTRILH